MKRVVVAAVLLHALSFVHILLSMDQSEHERRICDLLDPARRARYRQLLAKGEGKARRKFVESLNHTLVLDDRFAILVPANHAESQDAWILAELRRRGAPDNCYVISTNGDLDGRTMPLVEALGEVYGMLMGTLICCVPGRLAYYEGEDAGVRYILDRPGHRS